MAAVTAEVFIGALAALLAYRGLAVLTTEVLRARVRHDRDTTIARGLARNGSASWSGERSRAWRLMQRLGINEARTR